MFSVGATLYRLLTGKRVWPRSIAEQPGSGDSRRAINQGAAAECIKSLPTDRPDVPAELCTVLRKLLATNPSDRFDSAAEVGKALEPFTAGCDLVVLINEALEFSDSADEQAGSQAQAESVAVDAAASTRAVDDRQHQPAHSTAKPLIVARSIVGIGAALLAAVAVLTLVVNLPWNSSNQAIQRPAKDRS